MRWTKLVLSAASVLAVLSLLGLLGLQKYIGGEVEATGDSAVQQFGGDRVEALTKLVACDNCVVRDRNRAVWALGQMGDRRALPVLREHHTRNKCNHRTDLCEYELGKAIKKIEGTWDLRASLSYEGTDPTSR
jgi:HEAT repeat protein